MQLPTQSIRMVIIMNKILIVEDNIEIANLLKLYLEGDNFNVTLSFDGQDGLNKINNNQFDLILCDLMMPNVDGYQLIKKVREFSNIPIIIISANIDDSNKILGLNIGADDYITKPFNPLEVNARVKACLRRSLKHDLIEDTIKYDDLEILVNSCRVLKNNSEVFLTAKEYKILLLLISNRGRIFSKAQIYNALEGNDFVDDNVVMVHISHLRSKLDQNINRYIKTIKGLGYRIEK